MCIRDSWKSVIAELCTQSVQNFGWFNSFAYKELNTRCATDARADRSLIVITVKQTTLETRAYRCSRLGTIAHCSLLPTLTRVKVSRANFTFY